MACALTQSYSLDCRDNVGGIKAIYVAEIGRKNALTIAASGYVTAHSLTSGTYWTYELEKETSSLTENWQTNDVNGTLFWEQDLTFTIRKLSATLRNELKLLAQNRLMIIILDRNSKYWLMGSQNGAELQASNGATGTAMGDFNGYTLTLKAKEEVPMPEVSSSLIASLIPA